MVHSLDSPTYISIVQMTYAISKIIERLSKQKPNTFVVCHIGIIFC